jgi:hypothetical protein
VATEFQVFRLIDHTHSAPADLAQDGVMGHRLPCGLGGRGHYVDMLGVGEGKVNEMASRRCWRNIAITLKMPGTGILSVTAWFS